MAVVSVHLKSHMPETDPTEPDRSGLARTKAEVRGLAHSVVPWAEEQVRLAREADKGLNSLGVATYVILGDFNLAEDDTEGLFGNDGTTFGGGAWDDLNLRGFHALLPPGQPTNMGPPVCEFDKCYDNILYRRVTDTAAGARGGDVFSPVAQVYRAMQAEMEEMAGIVEVANSARTGAVTHAVKGMKKAFQKEVFCTWSDHKPVYTHFSCGAVPELVEQEPEPS